ncbi:hypothetical protein AWZ03_000007 [Drosophila navojoa]|uniref:UBC core domain-containing protein n=1 Tax=Drosophila navojoa TaxID=7232 RepID=A0A484C008_DRONA|nr:ubiquitin-conjugating enzyme E2-17 kDa-like [Drosophila navojoa]TDG53192.1 hypothetical protein AWZ03_000007 [Drosophila navojoa]
MINQRAQTIEDARQGERDGGSVQCNRDGDARAIGMLMPAEQFRFDDEETNSDSDVSDVELGCRMYVYPRYPTCRLREHRIQRELLGIWQTRLEGCHVDVLEDNLYEWGASLSGPVNTPYEGGTFHMLISFPPGYPFVPPILKFITKIYHCNVHNSLVCPKKWTPVATVAKLMVSILSMMVTPDPEDPLNPAIAQLYINHRSEHDKIARAWTRRFAME